MGHRNQSPKRHNRGFQARMFGLSDAVAEWCPTRPIPPIVKDWKQGIKILKTVTSSTNIFLCLEHIVFGTQRCHIFKEFDQEKP